MINNKILALKYRPIDFKDLIGQDVMVQTITNGIKLNKTPNAYLLTGIRGIGKTTTARLIAKALNCLKNTEKKNDCSKQNLCNVCKEIVNSNHIDVLEMDAASKTGIDDVRELIENAKYSPTSAKFKIFIIDEVHMLSKQAFNGLLKTLEEPPPNLKFILATTEARKIPVTILSRCQRFDLKRVKINQIISHLKKIVEIEKGNISDNALKLIARSGEGSVRDSISLLDRALISSEETNKVLDENSIRDMLGLADKSKVIEIAIKIFEGDQNKALEILNELIDLGIDAKNFLNDLLEVLHLFSRKINLKSIDKDITISESEEQLINDYSENLENHDLAIFWQLTLKTIEDLKIVMNEKLLLEMLIIQMVHLKGFNLKNNLNENLDKAETIESMNVKRVDQDDNILETKKEDAINKIKNQMRSTHQLKKETTLSSPKIKEKKLKLEGLDDLIKLAGQEKEIELKYDLERNVKLVSFDKGKISISFNDKLNKNFIKLLSEKLRKWTGERWIISLSKDEGQKTIYEKNVLKEKKEFEEGQKSDTVKKIKKSFSDAELGEIKED